MNRVTIKTFQSKRKLIKNEMIAFLRKPTKRKLKPGGKMKFFFKKQIIGKTTIKNILPITVTSKEIILNGKRLDDLSVTILVKTLGFTDKKSMTSFYCSGGCTQKMEYVKWNSFALPCPFCEKNPYIIKETEIKRRPYTIEELEKTPRISRDRDGIAVKVLISFQYLCPCGLSHRASGKENLDYRAAKKWNTIVELIQSGLSRNVDFSSGELNGEFD